MAFINISFSLNDHKWEQPIENALRAVLSDSWRLNTFSIEQLHKQICFIAAAERNAHDQDLAEIASNTEWLMANTKLANAADLNNCEVFFTWSLFEGLNKYFN